MRSHGNLPTRLLPVAAVLLLMSGCAHGAASADDGNGSIEPDADAEIARLRHENARLRKELRSAEERARIADRGASTSEVLPHGRALPVVKLTPKGGEAGVRHTDSVSLAQLPNSGGFEEAAGDSSDWGVSEALTTASDVVAAVPYTESYDAAPAPSSSPSYDSSKPKSYRLVGSHLVAETKRKRPRRQSSGSKRRGSGKSPVIAKYEAAMSTYRSGRFTDAERAFDEIVRAHPNHDYADNALYWKGEAAYDQSHYSDALAAFTAVVERYGGGNKAPDALLKIGLCYGRLGDSANARDVLTQLISAYPNARATGIARSKLEQFPKEN